MIQRQIDYDRATQLRMIDDCELPATAATDGVRVSPSALKSVLRIIDSLARQHGECWASHRTIAQRAGLRTIRTVIRAMQALQALSVITSESQIGRPNRHRIVWSELSLRCPDRRSHTRATCDAPTHLPVTRLRGGCDAPTPTCDAPTPEPPRATYEPPPPTSSPESDAWQEAEEAVAAQGVGDSARAIEAARTKGLTPAHVVALAEHFAGAATTQRWGPGVLYHRLRNAVPGDDPAQRWPAIRAAVSSRGDAIPAAELRQRDAMAQAQQQRDRAAQDGLEAEHGPWLDAMSPEERDQLALLLPDVLRQLYRRRGCAERGLVREALLERIAAPP